MICLVIGITNDSVALYGVYENRKLAEKRTKSLEGNPYETYKIVEAELNKAMDFCL